MKGTYREEIAKIAKSLLGWYTGTGYPKRRASGTEKAVHEER